MTAHLFVPDSLRARKGLDSDHQEASMQRSDLLRLARLGANARIAELQREIDAIRRKFPGLKRGPTSGPAHAAAGSAPAPSGGRRNRNLSAAGRRAIAAAARRRWAAWR